MAPVASQTGLSADIDSLPPWEAVIQGLGGPACEFYFGTATGSYVSRKYVLDFSAEAKGDTDEVWVQQHQVLVTVSRPKADGTAEVLPERVAVLAVCLHPGTERGRQETTGSVKAILKDVGIPLPDKMWASARTGEDGRWAEFWRLTSGWAAPGSLLAAQDADPCHDPEPSTVCEPPRMRELFVTTERTCPVGFDHDVVEDTCNLNFVGEGTETEYLIPPGNIPTRLGLGGRNNGDNGDDGDEGSRPVAFNLNCNSPPRGSTGGCHVTTTDTAVTLSDLSYAWVTGAGVARPADSGDDPERWEGTATSTISMTVGISGPEVADTTLTGTVTVMPRTWSLPMSTAGQVFSDSGLAANEWGAFLYRISNISTAEGTGPWQGQPYTTWSADVVTALHLHPDLDPLGGPAYPTTSDSSRARLNRSCAGWTPRASSASLLTVNGACGTSGTYGAWATAVGDHETKHKDYYNQCARSQDVRDKFAEIEALTGARVGELFAKLRTDLADMLMNGILGNIQGARPGFFWSYRQAGDWLLNDLILVGHGRSPCP